MTSAARPNPRHASPFSAVAVDIAAYSPRTAAQQLEARTSLAAMLERAAEQARVERSRWNIQDTGDGELALVPVDIPKALLVADFVRELAGELRDYNRTRVPEAWIRLRAAFHHGDARLQSNGFAGATPVVVERLVNCRYVRAALDVEPDAPLAVVLSDRMHEETVAQRERGLDPAHYTRVEIAKDEIKKGDPFRVAWVTIPGVRAPNRGQLGAGAPGEWPHLLLRDPDGVESTYDLSGVEVVIGRAAPNSAPELALTDTDQQVSRSHCFLRREQARWLITNTSDNGTLHLDGQWVPLEEPYRMRDGDTFRIRATRLEPDLPRHWEFRFFDPNATNKPKH